MARTKQATGVLLVSAVLIGLYVLLRTSGHPRSVGVTVVASVYGVIAVASLVLAGLGDRRRRREVADRHGPPHDGVQTYRFSESVQLPHPPEEVWSLVAPVEHAPRLTRDVAAARRLPGTGEGVGERQELTLLDGRRLVFEVTAYDAGRRTVCEAVDPPPVVPSRHTCTVEPIEDGALLTYAQEWDVPERRRFNAHEWEAEWRQQTRAFLDRVRETLEAQ